MDTQRLYQLVNKEVVLEETDIPQLRALVGRYPYFHPAVFLLLKAIYTYNIEDFDNELKNQSILISDRTALFYYIFSEEYDHFFQETGKKVLTDDKTSVLLNAFFESKGEKETDTELEYSIFNSSLATIDYFSYIKAIPEEDEEEAPIEPEPSLNLKHQHIIDTFIHKAETECEIRILPEGEPTDSGVGASELLNEETEDELNEDMFFTETLAKIYIKQKKYEKAYKIIKHLSLNYPKKSIYFADQLSFLEKLIINSKYKNTK